jgi:Fe-S-cluster containining protein
LILNVPWRQKADDARTSQLTKCLFQDDLEGPPTNMPTAQDSTMNGPNTRHPLGSRAAVTFSVELMTQLGQIRGKVDIASGPLTLADLAPTAFEITDILVSRARRQEEQKGKRISCRPGCGACCCQMVPLSPPEAFYLADLIDSFDPDRHERIMHRFEAIAAVLEEKDMVERLLEPEYTDDPVLAIAGEYFSLKMPCPFLADDSCSIHPYRPVACREYNVTSPALHCADPYSFGVEKVPMPLPLSAPLANLAAELTHTKPRLVPLTLAPRWVAGHAETRNRHWPGLELFQQFMASLGHSGRSSW